MSIEDLQYDWEHKQEIILRGELYVEIVESKVTGEPSKRLIEIFSNLIVESLKNFQFSYSSYDDLYQTAFLQLLSYWKNYNEKKGTDPKMYMMQIIKSALACEYMKITKLNKTNIICLQDIQQE